MCKSAAFAMTRKSEISTHLMHSHCDTNNRIPRWSFIDSGNQRWDTHHTIIRATSSGVDITLVLVFVCFIKRYFDVVMTVIILILNGTT